MYRLRPDIEKMIVRIKIVLAPFFLLSPSKAPNVPTPSRHTKMIVRIIIVVATYFSIVSPDNMGKNCLHEVQSFSNIAQRNIKGGRSSSCTLGGGRQTLRTVPCTGVYFG